jgi:hypothetical protein
MAKLELGGDDGLVAYLAARLGERGHAIGEPADAYIRVVDPTREPFEVHVSEIAAAAGRLVRGGVTISVVTRHGSKLLARYARAEKTAKVEHGVAGVRSVGIVTDEVRDPATTGMNPVEPALHARLFPDTLDPEVVVLAVELMLGHDDRVVHAGSLECWLLTGAGTIRDLFTGLSRDPRRARAALLAAGIACEASPTITATKLVGPELARLVPGGERPVDYDGALRDDDDLDDALVGLWANGINAALDRHAARLAEPRRVWHLDRKHVAFTTASEWAIASRRGSPPMS